MGKAFGSGRVGGMLTSHKISAPSSVRFNACIDFSTSPPLSSYLTHITWWSRQGERGDQREQEVEIHLSSGMVRGKDRPPNGRSAKLDS